MKYALIQCVNGNFSIVSEHGSLQAARVAFHDNCKILWNAPDVIEGFVAIVDSTLAYVDGKIEVITHSEPEQEE